MTLASKATVFMVIYFGSMVALAFFLPAFPQDPAYHNFARDKEIFGVPNFWNVVSNAPFLVVGMLGLNAHTQLAPATTAVFRAGVFLTGLGSAYYHFTPSNETLFWDRLPMTIAFSGVVAALVERRIDRTLGRLLVFPLVIASALTVIYWMWTEGKGRGNLTPYGIVQFGTMLLVILVLLLFPQKSDEQRYLWLAIVAYVVAKLLEAFDQQIGQILVIMGGHPIKHVAAAVGCWFVSRALFDKDHPIAAGAQTP